MKKKSRILFLVSLVCLMAGQLGNLWKGANDREFNRGLTPAGDGYAIGKMALMEQEGTFKNIGALALIIPHVPLGSEEMTRFQRSFMTSLSYDAYMQNVPIKKHRYYFSRIGLNGFFYGLWNNLFNPNPKSYIKFLHFQKSLLFSLLLSGIVVWIAELTNLFGAILFLGSLLFSPVVTMMGTSLYYVPFAFLVPFVVPIYFLHKEYKGELKFTKKHFLICGFAFLLNLVFNCFELISTVCILSVIPFIFYGLLSNSIKTAIGRSIAISAIYISMCVFTMGLVVTQYKVAQHATFGDGVAYVKKKFLTRTTGEKINNGKNVGNQQVQESKDASYGTVLDMSFSNPAMSVNGKREAFFGLNYLGLFSVFGIVSLLVLLLHFIKKVSTKHTLAIVITTWISILAPLSWHIIFKPHSYLHMHIVVFTWLLPFTIFGFLLIGKFIDQLYNLKQTKVDQLTAV